MLSSTRDHVNKFQQEHEIYLETHDLVSSWVISARIPKKGDLAHRSHYGRKYVTSRNEGGNVLVYLNPHIGDSYVAENWGKMDSFDEFVEKALVRILEDKAGSDSGQGEGCGTGCT